MSYAFISTRGKHSDPNRATDGKGARSTGPPWYRVCAHTSKYDKEQWLAVDTRYNGNIDLVRLTTSKGE